MIGRLSEKLACMTLLTVMLLSCSGFAASLDYNGDGVVRVAVLSVPQHVGEIQMETVCADLEHLIKRSDPDQPVRVTFEPIENNLHSLMGWFYHPDSQAARTRLKTGLYDYLLLVESEEIVCDFPEFHFEGVRAISQMASLQKIRCASVLMSRPASTFRDKRVDAVAAMAYRVGNGCGVDVIPAAFGWQEALRRNRMTGDSPVKARACAYLTAAAIYCQLADREVPKAALEAYWTTKKTTSVLVQSAYDAVSNERVRPHYAGPFEGVVRIDPRIAKRLKIYIPNTMEDDPVRENLKFVLDAAFQDGFWRSPTEWYRDGFDRYAAAFDLVYGDRQQMELYLDPNRYTSDSCAQTNHPKPCLAVYARTPEGSADGLSTLRTLESVLMGGYQYAKKNNLSFIPYPLAWARAHQENAEFVRKESQGHVPDWLSFMLANMLYTVVTDRCQLTPEKDKPRIVNKEHPRGYHEACARIGYETIAQLSHLSASINTLLLRCESYRINRENPGFAAIRLLNRPTREVRVFCATDPPKVAELSRETLVFTPDNYDIEQTIRILPATEQKTLFCHFMASAQSEDSVIDGANDLRPFLLNFDATTSAQMALTRDSVSPGSGYQITCYPKQRPADLVCARVIQHDEVTQELCFSPDFFSGIPIRIQPTADDYKQGVLAVTIQVNATDDRFNGTQVTFPIKVSNESMVVPDVRVVSPARASEVEGPAFVTARAEVNTPQQVVSLDLYLGAKKLGGTSGEACVMPVEKGPPQSRLTAGNYTLRAVATTTNGLVVSSTPLSFSVRDAANSAP